MISAEVTWNNPLISTFCNYKFIVTVIRKPIISYAINLRFLGYLFVTSATSACTEMGEKHLSRASSNYTIQVPSISWVQVRFTGLENSIHLGWSTMNPILNGICGDELETPLQTFQAKSNKLPCNQKEYKKQVIKSWKRCCWGNNIVPFWTMIK